MQNLSKNPVGIYEKAFPASLSWEERLREAAKAGYDFIEMSIDDGDERLSRLEWSHADRVSLRHSIENSGVPILTIGLSGHRKFPLGSASPQVRERGLEVLCRAIDLAGDLGVRLIQLMGYDVFYEPSDGETQARFLEGLFQGVRCASAAGVMLGLENVDVNTVNSVEKALRFVQEVNSPWLNLYPDMGNLVASGYEPVGQLKLAQEYLVGVHIKEALPGEYRGVVFGKGLVPFDGVFRALSEMEFSGPMAVEMWAHLDQTGDPIQAAADVRQFVSRLAQTYSGD
ncbi:MAG: L-ribulose-5-phosphate 3-epimerase [Anaerolineaceae bacterium]|jgi:predicted hexulose-6-phosphate isomerase|nr:L-ribulose-5-phosphate 3-epimerase [Anaerolineaceae bacterium]